RSARPARSRRSMIPVTAPLVSPVCSVSAPAVISPYRRRRSRALCSLAPIPSRSATASWNITLAVPTDLPAWRSASMFSLRVFLANRRLHPHLERTRSGGSTFLPPQAVGVGLPRGARPDLEKERQHAVAEPSRDRATRRF